MSPLAIEFHSDIVVPALITGVAAAGLYGLIAVAMVLSYRISRTVAFVHGGITLMGTLMFWYLTAPVIGLTLLSEGHGASKRPELAPWLGMVIVVALGVLIACLYGAIVTSARISKLPHVTLTTFSLAIMLILAGALFSTITAQGERTVSPFGSGKVDVFGTYVTTHQIVTLAFLAVFVATFSVLLKSTRTGIYMRAIADNVEASRLVGVPIGRVGTIVYGISGAIAALSGALLASTVGTDRVGILFIFLRALIVCVLGGFGSVGLALAGALLLAIVDTVLNSGTFGTVGAGQREVIVVGLLFGAVLVIDRLRSGRGSDVLAARGM